MTAPTSPRTTLRASTNAANQGSSPRRASYFRAWQHLPRNLGYLLVGLPLAVAGFVVVLTLVITGVVLTIIWVGIPILVAGLLVARAFGALDATRLKAAGQTPIEEPQWGQPTRTARPPSALASNWRGRLRGRFALLMRTFGSVLGDGRYWVRVVFNAPVNFALSIISWVFAVVWTAGGLGGISYWFWIRFTPETDSQHNVWLHQVVWHFFDPSYTIEPTLAGKIAGESVFFAIVGVLFLITWPLIASTFVTIHHAVARGMLSEWRSVKLERRAQEAEASRESAVIAEDHSLRRLERDIHDGPQQRLIRLQFDVASAQRALHASPEAATELLDSALQQSREALEELRELSRGFAPPILQDRGLEAALQSLAARSPLPTTVSIEVHQAPVGIADVERSVYFIASELLTNAIKHAQASRARISLSVSNDSEAIAEASVALPGQRAAAANPDTSPILTLTVSDDGNGGAVERGGHGLAGVSERLGGLRGQLTISSPLGGPTTITARVPLKSVP